MGQAVSNPTELPDNIYLKKFVSQQIITQNDPFWNQLLSFNLKLSTSQLETEKLIKSMVPLYKSLLANYSVSGNISSLIQVYLSRSTELKTSAHLHNSIFIWQAQNALVILRFIVQYLVETLSETDMINVMRHKGPEKTQDTSPLVEQLVSSLIEVIVDVPCSDVTYYLHVEATTTLIIFLSSQIFNSNLSPRNFIMRMLLNGKPSIHACILVKTLLRRFVQNDRAPKTDEKGSIIVGLASGLWNVLTLGLSAGQETPGDHNLLEKLSSHSLFLLLILVNHSTSEKGLHNPFRVALLNAKNFQDSAEGAPIKAVASFKVDYCSLYKSVVSNLACEQVTLLLYILLHKNVDFRTYVLSRTDVESVVLPILQTLYNASNTSSYHIYMSLIILLILSEDESFNKVVHEVKLKNILWFTERTVTQINLGSLLVLVVIRILTFNMTKMRDKYLHTNCLAALANMSNQFRNLHLCTSQKLVNLFEILAKKYTRQYDSLRDSGSCVVYTESDISEVMSDIAVLEEVMRMVLEILNSTFTNQLTQNPNLLYSILYKRHLFAQISCYPNFEDVIQNISIIITFLMQKLELSTNDPSVGDVQAIIRDEILLLPSERIKKFPELKFKYVEESDPEEFFVPYIWNLINQHSGIGFDTSKIALFDIKFPD